MQQSLRKAIWVLSLISSVGLLAACPAGGQGRDVSVAELRSMLHASEIILVDVRSPGEHASGMIPGTTVFIPYEQLGMRWQTERNTAKDTPIILYCASGQRSTIGVETLRGLGYTNVRNLTGGITAWQRSGGQIVRP